MTQNKTSTFSFDNSENVAYDNPSFPAYIRKCSFSQIPHYSAITHWHEDLEFLIVLSGCVTYIIDGEIILLNASDGIFINSRHMHTVFPSNDSDCEFICILLHPILLTANREFSEKYAEPFIRNQECPYVLLWHTTFWQQKIITLLTTLALNKESEMKEVIIQRNFFHIFQLLLENVQTSPIHNFSHIHSQKLNNLKEMMLYVQEHYDKTISLKDIASCVPCSTSKCIKLFKEYLKEPPITYLIKYRLSKSCILLTTTDLSITEIALQCGFNGSSYFCEIFKKYYGLSPITYKKQNSEVPL